MDVEALIAGYEDRRAVYTEGDFVERFTLIRAARISGGSAEQAPDDRMVALLASGRVTDAEYFRLARMLGVDSTGLIYAEPPKQRSLAQLLLATWRAFSSFVSRLRRA